MVDATIDKTLRARAVRKHDADKRRDRALESRASIIDAAMQIVEGGKYSPTALEVAHKAGVGARTLFRHFPEMDDLYREMSAQLEARVWPIISRAFQATDWRDQLREMVDRRAKVFEFLLPYRTATNFRRMESDYLRRDWERLNNLERHFIEEVVPSAVRGDPAFFAAIIHVLSYFTWQTLRQEQRLAPEDAAQVMRSLLDGLLAQIPA